MPHSPGQHHRLLASREEGPALAIGGCLEGQGRQLGGIDDEVELQRKFAVGDLVAAVGPEDGSPVRRPCSGQPGAPRLPLIAEIEHEVEEVVLLHGHSYSRTGVAQPRPGTGRPRARCRI